MRDPNERVAVFVEGANMFYAQRSLGWHLDFVWYWRTALGNANCTMRFIIRECKCPRIPQQRDFLTALRHLGFTIREKSMKEILDPESQALTRHASLEIEIVVDLFNTADRYDVAVLLSGDGDFERAVELLRSKGK